MIFYTDGSCLGNGGANAKGGYGVVGVDENEELKFVKSECDTNTTNNRQELKSILDVMSNFGVKAADLIRNGVLKDSCSHCGENIKDSNTKYCEKCYQLLIAKNAELQLKVKKRIPEEDVISFMSKLRDLIIKPQTNKYDANDKLKDISELYLKHINKLGGIKYESND